MTREKFEEVFCQWCGSQLCSGAWSEAALGCEHYRRFVLTEQKDEKPVDDTAGFIARVRVVLEKYKDVL